MHFMHAVVDSQRACPTLMQNPVQQDIYSLETSPAALRRSCAVGNNNTSPQPINQYATAVVGPQPWGVANA